jgi:hypothetical protein
MHGHPGNRERNIISLINRSSGGHASIATLLPSHASLVIIPRVPHFKLSCHTWISSPLRRVLGMVLRPNPRNCHGLILWSNQQTTRTRHDLTTPSFKHAKPFTSGIIWSTRSCLVPQLSCYCCTNSMYMTLSLSSCTIHTALDPNVGRVSRTKPIVCSSPGGQSS